MHEFNDTRAKTLTYDNMNDWLVPLVPERRETYERLVELYEGDPVGPHVAYEDVLNPYLIALLNEGGHEARLASIFAFIEELAQHGDERVTNVVEVSTVEGILCGGLTGDALERAIALMGPTTRTIAREMASMSNFENEILRILDRQ
jgi:hypothetical protein